jgi:hypothetical protein
MFVITTHAQTYRQIDEVIANSAVDVSNTFLHLRGTIGQPIIGNIGNSSDINGQGFWHPETASSNSAEIVQVGPPTGFVLEQNFPNPFNPMTHINFSVPNNVHAVLRVYTLTGELVKTLVDGELYAGNYNVGFNADGMAAGAYFYTLEMSGQKSTKQMTIIK